ncbi:MAG: hypothetical protein ACI944_000580, partial [Natronomonas sp.]
MKYAEWRCEYPRIRARDPALSTEIDSEEDVISVSRPPLAGGEWR